MPELFPNQQNPVSRNRVRYRNHVAWHIAESADFFHDRRAGHQPLAVYRCTVLAYSDNIADRAARIFHAHIDDAPIIRDPVKCSMHFHSSFPVLTEDGMLLKRRAQEIVSLSDKTVQELSHKEDVLSGEN